MLRIGTTFGGRFRVDREIAVGGMGIVYEVFDERNHRARALKVMQAHLVRDAKKREAFEREALVGATIESGHVVEVLDRGVDVATGMPWILMELLRGEDLEQRVRREGALPPSEVARLFRQLLHALGAAHRKGVLHMDLKPANLFLAQPQLEGGTSVLKVLDFGIARIVEAGRTSAELTTQGGTLAWMAPEQADAGERVKPTVDVWPLGLIAFFLLTGREYWKAQNVPAEQYSARTLLREVMVEQKPPASLRAQQLGATGMLPAGFDAWFARCVAEDSTERWRDANEAIPVLIERMTWAAPVQASVVPSASLPAVPTQLPWALASSPAGMTEAVPALAERIRASSAPATNEPRQRTLAIGVGLSAGLLVVALGVRVFSGSNPSPSASLRAEPRPERGPGATADAGSPQPPVAQVLGTPTPDASSPVLVGAVEPPPPMAVTPPPEEHSHSTPGHQAMNRSPRVRVRAPAPQPEAPPRTPVAEAPIQEGTILLATRPASQCTLPNGQTHSTPWRILLPPGRYLVRCRNDTLAVSGQWEVNLHDGETVRLLNVPLE